MKLLNESLIIEKKSKFIGMLYEIDNKEDVLSILDSVKSNNKGYRHIPYAYYLKNTASKSDDKEPNGTAGLPIYTVLEHKKLNNALIVVIRYFVGIKLGAGGLFRAYMETASKVVNPSKKP